MSNKRNRVSKIVVMSMILSPMIPIWVPKKRYSEPPPRFTEPESLGPPKDDIQETKECAICRKSNADYEHSCGVAFHKACIRQYFEALSAIDGAEKICPHCYGPFPINLDSGPDSAVEVSTILDVVYNQYIELSDKFSIALIDGRIRDVSVFLASPTDDEYFINVDFGFYPRKPTFSFPDDLLANMDGLDELLERLNNWDSSFPPRIVDEILDIQSRIRPKEISEFQQKEILNDDPPLEKETLDDIPPLEKETLDDIPPLEKETLDDIPPLEKDTQEPDLENKEEIDYVEVLPEEDIVEVSLEDGPEMDPNLVPFFDLMPESEAELPEFTPVGDSFENEEAIAQYLDLSNSFSVELIDDEIYNVIVHLSSIDSGIYNIYPITINFKKYPKKPQMMFNDELLVRIRNLDDTLTKLKFWDEFNPPKIVDILKELEIELMEDSLVENEIEMIKREFNTRRITKNRIVVTFTSYGQKSYDVELNLKYYPQPPLIYFPSELKQIDVEELEGLKMWEKRPQKRIMDVLRSLSQAINNIYRLEFEESLLRMIADEFDVIDDEYQLKITLPFTKDEDPEIMKSSSGELLLRIKVPESYPLSPPKIEIDSDSEDLTNDARVFLTYLLKSWSPSMFISDAVNRLSLSLSNTSLYKCLICGQKECPSCGQPLLTQPVKDSQEICEVPCIHCKRPYHVHCLTEALDMGIKKCGFCFTDLDRFFGSRLHDFVK